MHDDTEHGAAHRAAVPGAAEHSRASFLPEDDRRFRSMFYGAPVGISLIDLEGRYLSVNPVRAHMLGYSEDELIGRAYWEVTHPDDIEYDEEVNAQARSAGLTHYQLEKRFVCKDGSVRWCRITVSAVNGADMRPEYFISIAEDITDQRVAEEERALLLAREHAARTSAERVAAERAAILRQAADGIIIANSTGEVTFANDVARRLHGWIDVPEHSTQFPTTYRIYAINGDEYGPEDAPLARAIRLLETTLDAQWKIVRADGSEVIARGSAAPVLQDGTLVGAVATVRDVTAQHYVDRQKDDFLSAAAHDLRTPLTAIKGRIQLLRRRAQRDHPIPVNELLHDLARVEANATRMIGLINEMLDVANIQIGRPMRLARCPTDLGELVRTIIEEQQHFTERHDVRVVVEPDVVGYWDPERVGRVLSNLLSNAVKYSPGGGVIAVTVQRAGDEALLAVSDTGVGIPSPDLPHVFDRFHRGGNVDGKIAGTGIGLAAVRQIVEQHGGQVTVVSEVGKGTEVVVRLPLSP